MRVLIAQDDAVCRILLDRTLRALGHECVAAREGEEAWRLWLDDPAVDVVVSDWMMPGIDGPELCRRMRDAADHGRAEPYFILLTALPAEKRLPAGLHSGADDWLSKPLARGRLRDSLSVAARVVGLRRRLAAQGEELRQLRAELARLAVLARTDALTGAGNRLRLAEDLAALDGRAERYAQRYSLLLCDLDSFKAYNDRHGHLAGDGALRRVAGLFLRELRPADALYRFGGDEFLIVLPEQGLEDARAVAERLRRGLESLDSGGVEGAERTGGAITASFGLAACTPQNRRSAEDLIHETDRTLYRGKKAANHSVEA